MTSRRLLIVVMAAQLLASGCGAFGGGGARQPQQPVPQPPAEFTNRVWRVVTASNDIAPGTLYVFLSDNTMLITPPTATTPVLGRWHAAGGGLVLITEGFRYPTDIVELGAERFVIRIHRGATSVDVALVPARDLSPRG